MGGDGYYIAKLCMGVLFSIDSKKSDCMCKHFGFPIANGVTKFS